MIQAPDKIYVEEDILDHPLTQKILSKIKSTPVTFIQDYKKIGQDKSFNLRADEDKNSLALASKKGELVKSIGRMDHDSSICFMK